MRKLMSLLYQMKFILLLLFLTCISRSMVVLYLNQGYAGLVDHVLSGEYNLIINSTFILLFTGVLHVAMILSQNCISSVISEKVGYLTRTKAIDGILNTEYKTVENLSSGISLSKLNTDLTGVTTWIKNELSAFISEGFLFTIILIAMLYTNWRLTIISFFMVPFFSVGSYLLSKPITTSEEKKCNALAEVNLIAKSILDAFPILKLFNMKKPFLGVVDEKISISVLSEMKANSIRAKLMSINGFLSYTPTVILWGFGGYLAIKGSISPGKLLAFINMSNYITGPLLNLPARIDGFRTSSVNISRVFDLLDKIQYEKKEEKCMLSNTVNRTAVEFRHVTFGYSENKNNLEDVSFTVKKGNKVVIVGESGCGKSTILKLIPGLYPVNSGEVLFFGSNVANTELNFIRNNISFIPQESQLFPVSIYENITCGHPMPMENVVAACKAAQLENLIDTLPNGIYTNIGECGNKLSGGERQRICVARAIAKNAPLFLLDETTSALDGQTESDILDYFDRLVGTKTIIFVTHNIKNAVNADLVICMKNGQICESDTHENLLKMNGYYAKLYKLETILEVL